MDRHIAILAISASLVLAAVGVSMTSVPSGTAPHVVRDPENPAYAGNTIGSSATGSGAQVVRDPENPHWSGSTISPASFGGAANQGLK